MPIYHKHHIIPKHMGGTDDSSNLVQVTIEQHANLHKQLWEDLGCEEDRIAWLCLSGQISNAEAIILAVKKANTGRKWTKEFRSKRSDQYTSEGNPFFGKKHSDETKSLISKKRTGKLHTEETKQFYSQTRKGELNGFYGKKHSEESKMKMRKPKQKKEKTQC